MREVKIRPRAQLDIESIYLYLAVALDAPQAAADTVEAIYETVELVANMPDLGAPFESERLSRPYRRMLAKSYWVYYSTDNGRITVWRIIHTRQDIDDFTLIEL